MKNHLFIRIPLCILSFLGLIWFCIPFFWNVKNIGNLSGIALCVVILLVCIFYPWIQRKCSASKAWKRSFLVVRVLFCLGIVWTAVLTGFMMFGINSFPTKQAVVIVLGSKVSGHVPSADLMIRINAAGDYLKLHSEAKCIASGGQGPGELETEAAVIKKYLVQQGISASRIITEDKSKTTQENLRNSLALMKKEGMGNEVAIVTDEYHQFRAGKIAQSFGAVPYSVCAHTPWYIFSACYARELLALTKFLIIP